jgi:hypothetical protein
MKYTIYDASNAPIEVRESLTDAKALAQGYANADHQSFWVRNGDLLIELKPAVPKKGFKFTRVQCLTRVHPDDKQHIYDTAASLNRLRETES